MPGNRFAGVSPGQGWADARGGGGMHDGRLFPSSLPCAAHVLGLAPYTLQPFICFVRVVSRSSIDSSGGSPQGCAWFVNCCASLATHTPSPSTSQTSTHPHLRTWARRACSLSLTLTIAPTQHSTWRRYFCGRESPKSPAWPPNWTEDTRLQVLDAFGRGALDALVCTDLMSRGFDAPGVSGLPRPPPPPPRHTHMRVPWRELCVR